MQASPTALREGAAERTRQPSQAVQRRDGGTFVVVEATARPGVDAISRDVVEWLGPGPRAGRDGGPRREGVRRCDG